MSAPPVDLDDLATLLRWLIDLRVAIDDGHAIILDRLKPLCERELGHVKHVEIYGASREQTVEMIDHLRGVIEARLSRVH
jgi:hypothetical protein